MKKQTKFLAVIFVILFSACGSDDGDGGGSVDVNITVGTVTFSDVENNGNASDINVKFNISGNEDRVDHYKVFLVKQANRSSFDVAAAEALTTASLFTRIEKTGSAIDADLSADMTDTDGDAVGEGNAYAVFVLAVAVTGTESKIRSAAGQLTLAKTNILEIVAELPTGTGGLVVDEAGNVYSADFGASLGGAPGTKLYKITPTGEATLFASGFAGATGNTLGSDGNIYQSNGSGGRISKVTLDGSVSTFATGVVGPIGIVFDNDDNLYVAQCGQNSIIKITPDGTKSTFASGSIFSCPNGIAADGSGNLYVANFNNGNVIKISPSGGPSVLATVPGNNNGHLVFNQGSLYVAARGANSVYQLSLGGGLTRIAGSGTRGHKEGTALEAELSLPNDLGFSPDGKFLYINDVKPLTGTAFTAPLAPTMIKRVRLEK